MQQISLVPIIAIGLCTGWYIASAFRKIFPSKKSRMAQEAKWREEDLREIRRAIARMNELEKKGINDDK